MSGQEAAAKRANLMAQRQEAQDELDDTVREHVYSMQVEGLDDMMSGLKDNLDEWKESLSEDIETQNQVIKDAIGSITDQTSDGSIAKLLSNISLSQITSAQVSSLLTTFSQTLQNGGTGTDKPPATSGEGGGTQAPAAKPPAPAPASTPKPATSTSTAKPATPKQTVTTDQAQAAYKYILSKVKFASSQNDKWGVFNKRLYDHTKNRQIMIESSDAQAAWAKFGSGVGSYSPQNLYDVAVKTGIWDALLGIRTDKKKKKISSFPTIGVNQIHGYAKGGTVHKSGQYMTDEKGEEIIITKQGILRPLSAGTSVIPADITERLYAIASNYNMNGRVQGISASRFKRIGGENISPIINCPITIEGNANEQDVINAINKTLPKISKHVQNDIRKDLRKSGR